MFVSKHDERKSWQAGISHLLATTLSLVLCLIYLLNLPSHPVGIAALVAIGALVAAIFSHRGEVVTYGISTVVVMVVACNRPSDIA